MSAWHYGPPESRPPGKAAPPIDLEAAFREWTSTQAATVVRDCRQASAGLVSDALETLDVLRTLVPYSNVWSSASRDSLRTALLHLVGAVNAYVDDMLGGSSPEAEKKERPPVAPRPRPKFPAGSSFAAVDPGRHTAALAGNATAHDRIRAAMLDFYDQVLGRRRPDAKQALLAPLHNGHEARWLLHDGYLAHIELMTAHWASFADHVAKLRFFRAPHCARYAFLDRKYAGDAVIEEAVEARYKEALAAYEREQQNSADDDNIQRQLFQVAGLAEALFYHTVGSDGSVPSIAAEMHLRPRGFRWLARSDPEYISANLLRNQAELLMHETAFAAHLPCPIPASESNPRLRALGYRIGLPGLLRATGAVPSTVVAAASGMLPWVVTAPFDSQLDSPDAWYEAITNRRVLNITLH